MKQKRHVMQFKVNDLERVIIKEAADSENRSMSNYIRTLILKQNEDKLKEKLEGAKNAPTQTNTKQTLTS